jgi:3-hydroxyisobutyrate dehydrogenase-like beta-hydroxyacid dehydrogenase
MTSKLKIGLIGYGEVGKILTAALQPQVDWVGAWDIALADASKGPVMKRHAALAGVEACESAEAVLAKADITISAVTAANTLEVARNAVGSVRKGAYFFDLNSASPGTKKRAAQLIDGAGALYVEAGVMTSVPPYGIGVPMVIGGAHARELADRLTPLGFALEVVDEQIGTASAIKMCRSVMIKGMEAIVIESFATARRYGVEERVLESLRETFPGMDWEKQGAYFFSRVAEHGRRRSEEMREAANTVREAGFEPWMAAGTAGKHAWVAALGAAGVFAGVTPGNWRAYADAIIASEQGTER